MLHVLRHVFQIWTKDPKHFRFNITNAARHALGRRARAACRSPAASLQCWSFLERALGDPAFHNSGRRERSRRRSILFSACRRHRSLRLDARAKGGRIAPFAQLSRGVSVATWYGSTRERTWDFVSTATSGYSRIDLHADQMRATSDLGINGHGAGLDFLVAYRVRWSATQTKDETVILRSHASMMQASMLGSRFGYVMATAERSYRA